jgi:hypothetical protein
LFDSDHDGKVSKAEIGAMMRTMGYLSCSRQLDDIIARLDSDGKMNSKYNKLLIKPCCIDSSCFIYAISVYLGILIVLQ